MTELRTPRRLAKDRRREQLVSAAMPVVAAHGFGEFALEEVAERAQVTRNLLYHYFPRGRPDIVSAVVERAGHELTEDWVIGESLPLGERLAANFSRMAAHAMGPSDAWRVHRQARASAQRDLDEIVTPYLEMVISSVSLNHLGTREPPPMVHLALTGFLAFAETVLDEARIRRSPPERVLMMLADSLVATIAAARSAS